MRIAIISDAHLGHGSGTERYEDPFEALGEALNKSRDCDAVLLAGDTFDSRMPTTEVLTRCMELLIRPLTSPSKARISEGIGKDLSGLSPLHVQGMPVIAIHGTHERRVKGLLNPVQALEKAGFLVHLHAGGVVLERWKERVCVQGMSGVPEQFSWAVLERWNPSPRQGCFNILMLHQSVSPFVYAEHLLEAARLPEGFDLYVLGHIHESKRSSLRGSPLLIPGSLVHTQLTKDASAPRGFWIFDTVSGEASFIELRGQRRAYLIEHEGPGKELEDKIEALLEEGHAKKPVIRIKADADADAIKSRFRDRAIIFFSGLPKGDMPPPQGIEQQSLSVQETGRKLLKDNLKAEGLDPEAFEGVFDLLAEGRQEEALRLLSPRRKHHAG